MGGFWCDELALPTMQGQPLNDACAHFQVGPDRRPVRTDFNLGLLTPIRFNVNLFGFNFNSQ